MNPESRLFIDGELVPATSGRSYPNISPVTEEVIGHVADAGPEDMDRAIAAARRAFDTTDWSTNHELRLRCIRQLRDALVAVKDEFRQQIAAETGSPLGICGAEHFHYLCQRFVWNFFRAVTNLMNMRELEDEGKVMALADYAYPIKDEENPLLDFLSVDNLKIKAKYSSLKMYKELKRFLWRYPSEQFANMAQKTLEYYIIKLIKMQSRKLGLKQLLFQAEWHPMLK